MRVSPYLAGVILIVAALLTPPDRIVHAQTDTAAIGAASRVDTTAFRSPAGVAARDDLVIEDPVFTDDLVGTAPSGGLRLLFIDGADLVVGPGSEVVLDSFVYDPTPDQGLNIVLSRGVLRFSSGLLPEDNVSIQTLPATLGIRGTIVEVLTDGTWVLVRVIEGAGEIDGILATAGQYLFVPFPGAEPQVGPLPVGGFPPLLTLLGISYPLDELARFQRQTGDRGFFDLAHLLDLLQREPLFYLCGRNDTAGSSEDESGATCTRARIGGGGNDHEDNPPTGSIPPPPPDDDPYNGCYVDC